MSQIDVIIVIDTDTIITSSTVSEFRTRDNPMPVHGNTIQMITDPQHTGTGGGSVKLDIKAKVGDTIRWRAINLSYDSDFTVVLYDFIPHNASILISQPEESNMPISQPQGFIAPIIDILPAHPPHSFPAYAERIYSYVWIANTIAVGSVTYSFDFAITDHQGEPLGYYRSDPLITIGSG